MSSMLRRLLAPLALAVPFVGLLAAPQVAEAQSLAAPGLHPALEETTDA